jgi:hypothetical protein
MFRLAVLLGLVAFCAAKTPIDQCCSAEDRNIIQEQWKQLWRDTESSKVKIGFGRQLLLKVVELSPDAKALFKAVNVENPTSGEFSAHAMRVLNGLDMSINLLKDPEALDAALEHLADQHQVRTGVKKAHFKAFGDILSVSLPRILDDYNAMSWKSCFRYILTSIASKLSE